MVFSVLARNTRDNQLYKLFGKGLLLYRITVAVTYPLVLGGLCPAIRLPARTSPPGWWGRTTVLLSADDEGKNGLPGSPPREEECFERMPYFDCMYFRVIDLMG